MPSLNENESAKRYDIIQLVPSHKWGACLAIVDEVKSFGCVALVLIPHNDGTPPGSAFIRLNHADYEKVGHAEFVPDESAHS